MKIHTHWGIQNDLENTSGKTTWVNADISASLTLYYSQYIL